MEFLSSVCNSVMAGQRGARAPGAEHCACHIALQGQPTFYHFWFLAD